jgi:hypothetical protein
MKLLIMQFPLVSRHFIPPRSKYSPQHPVSNTLSLCSKGDPLLTRMILLIQNCLLYDHGPITFFEFH